MKPRDSPLSATQMRAQAYAEERAGRTWRAIALLKEAVERGPDDWTSVRQLADLLTRAGQRKAANEYYRRLAQNCELDQLHMQAIAVWKRILSNEPESASAHLKLGELYAVAGLRADSRKHYGAALAWYRESGRVREVAQVESRLSQLAASDAPDPRLIRPLSPEQAAGREERTDVAEEEFVRENLLQARLFRRYALPVQARARLDALLARFPDHVEARRELYDLLREVGPADEAREQQQLLAVVEKGGTVGAPPPAVSPAAEAFPLRPETPDEETPEERVPVEEPPPEAAPATVDEPAPSAVEEPSAPEETAPSADAVAPPPDGERDLIGEQIGREDYETRYNLGAAYREMGLLDEAIAELRLAAADPARLVECASLLADCFAEQELPARAVKWLEKGLAAPGLPAARRQALRYKLATVHEACGEAARALEIFTELAAEDAAFRDVAEKVRQLSDPAASR
jgi:tetratricopeptide (TPR) repeat protein